MEQVRGHDSADSKELTMTTPKAAGRALQVGEMVQVSSAASSTTEFPMRLKLLAVLDTTYPAPNLVIQQASAIVSIGVFFLIAVSIIVFCVESHPRYYQRDLVSLFAIEAVCIGVFTAEFVLRLILVPDRKAFLRSLLNIIDVASITPFYVDLILSDGSHLNSLVILRVVRLARVFRVFKLGKYSTGLQLVVHAMRQSQEALSLLAFILGIGLVLYASLVFIAEGFHSSFDEDTRCWMYDNDADIGPYAGKPSQFQSIPDSVWWALVTLATVGYGDQVPRTWSGKCVGFVTMIVGVLVLAFPIILISNNFSEAVKELANVQDEAEGSDAMSLPTVSMYEGSVDMPRPSPPGIEPGSPTPVLLSAPPHAATGPDTTSSCNRRSPFISPRVEPGSGTVVAHFKYGGRFRPVYYMAKLGNDGYQFRYDPLFAVSYDRKGVAVLNDSADARASQYLVRLEVMLDHELVQAMAMEAVQKTNLFERRKVSKVNTFASQVARIMVSVTSLPPDVRLLTSEFSSPGNSVELVFSAGSEEGLATAKSSLPECFLQCTCSSTFGAPARPDLEITLPLLLSPFARPGLALLSMRSATSSTDSYPMQ
eukprot:Hpha_TRINITY_DN9777_c0_g1::TRINITY_DN9777_c0_g1_i2::g.10432::m.10432/K04877/KCNA4; potassium voltage-gated channel Shaker-related subfamily A member 4